MSKRKTIPSRPNKFGHVGRLGTWPLKENPIQQPQSFPAKLKNISATKDATGSFTLHLDFATELEPGAGNRADPAFDPWLASQQQAVQYPGGIGSPEFALWATAQAVTSKRKLIEDDGIALLEAVQTLLVAGLRSPSWLTEAFKSRYRRFEAYEARTLDETFGHAPLDPRTVAAKARDRNLLHEVHGALVAAIEANLDEPIMPDGHPFATVGECMTPRLGKTKVYELYREAVERHGLQDIVQLRRVLLVARGNNLSSDDSR